MATGSLPDDHVWCRRTVWRLPGRSASALASRLLTMTKWEYATVPLLVHATKQILDQWGEDGWELVTVLPAVPAPAGAYVPAVRSGNLVYTAGQVPLVSGALAAAGKVGAEISAEDAKALARTCALNALAAVHDLVGIDAVIRIVKVVGFV